MEHKVRDIKIDLLKGLAILLVVLGHCVQYNYPKTFDLHPVFRLIYSFHMPLFMLLSGYVASFTFKGSGRQLATKAQTLLLPFFSWFVFSYFFYTKSVSSDGFWLQFLALLKNPDRGLWFLWVLFLNFVVLAIALRISRKYTVPILLLSYVLINFAAMLCLKYAGAMYGDIGSLGWHLLFFGGGYALKHYGIDKSNIFRLLCLLSLVAFPVLVWFWHRSATVYLSFLMQSDFRMENFVAFVYGLSVPLAGILFVFFIGDRMLMLPQKVKSVLIYTGKVSLEIYSTHFYWFALVVYAASLQPEMRVLLFFVIVTPATILVQMLIKKIPVLAFVMYGKKITEKAGTRL